MKKVLLIGIPVILVAIVALLYWHEKKQERIRVEIKKLEIFFDSDAKTFDAMLSMYVKLRKIRESRYRFLVESFEEQYNCKLNAEYDSDGKVSNISTVLAVGEKIANERTDIIKKRMDNYMTGMYLIHKTGNWEKYGIQAIMAAEEKAKNR